MHWLSLLIAGLLEIAWAIGLKLSEGLTNLKWTIVTIVGMLLSFVFLSISVKGLPIGTAYAVWTGIGAAGTAFLGIILFHEPGNMLRLFFIMLIIIGIIGLRLTFK